MDVGGGVGHVPEDVAVRAAPAEQRQKCTSTASLISRSLPGLSPPVYRGGVEEHGQHEQSRDGPGCDGDHPGYHRGSEPGANDRMRPGIAWAGRDLLGRRDGVTDGHVSVGRHDHQEDAAGDLVDGRGGVVRLAHDAAERPVADDAGHDQERDPDEETLVGDGQVQDVQVGHRVHLRETEDHVNDWK